MGIELDIDDVAAQSATAARELAELRAQLAEAKEVLSKMAATGWVSDALASGDTQRLAREICGLKREARAVLSDA